MTFYNDDDEFGIAFGEGFSSASGSEWDDEAGTASGLEDAVADVGVSEIDFTIEEDEDAGFASEADGDSAFAFDLDDDED